jgi:hypothetical protein
MSAAPQGELLPALSTEEARLLTDEVKDDAETLWAKLAWLYRGGAHIALGYSSWGAYYEAEFGKSGRQGYRLLEAAKVAAALPSDQLVNEAVARELAPVLREDPERVGEVWDEAVDRYGEQPTAAEVRAVVQEHEGTGGAGDMCVTEPHATERPCSRKRDRGRRPCREPALPGLTTCKDCTAYLAISRFKAKCARFEASRRDTERVLAEEVGWSPGYVKRKLREVYASARDGLDGEVEP